MRQFENYLDSNLKDVFIKITLVIFLIFYYSITIAQDSLKTNAILTTEKSKFDTLAAFKKLISIRDTLKNNDSISEVLIDDNSQAKDSTLIAATNKKIKKQKKIDTTHYSPKKAAIWGASFPGLGQIYMKKYWKLPIVYGIIGATLYFVVSNGQNLKKYNGYIRNVYDSIPNPAPLDQLDLGNLETRRNTYRKNLQIASFGTIFAWGLSIVDAVVDAHLHSFDISDKLAIKVKPQINYSNFTYYTGIGLNLKIK